MRRAGARRTWPWGDAVWRDGDKQVARGKYRLAAGMRLSAADRARLAPIHRERQSPPTSAIHHERDANGRSAREPKCSSG